jgi:hypothetical protein
VPLNWSVLGTADFDGDGMADILRRDNLRNTSIWFMDGTTVGSTGGVGNIPTTWSVVGTGDFNGDGMSDIVWRDAGGDAAIWLMKGAAVLSAGGLGNIPITLARHQRQHVHLVHEWDGRRVDWSGRQHTDDLDSAIGQC